MALLPTEYEFRSSWNTGSRLAEPSYTDLNVDLDSVSARLFVGYTS
jgi:hypothetical protein